jgi:hypothetical protein
VYLAFLDGRRPLACLVMYHVARAVQSPEKKLAWPSRCCQPNSDVFFRYSTVIRYDSAEEERRRAITKRELRGASWVLAGGLGSAVEVLLVGTCVNLQTRVRLNSIENDFEMPCVHLALD